MNSDLIITTWNKGNINEIYHGLEIKNWAPWLAASLTSLAGRALVFQKGQIAVCQKDMIVATISTNQINWNGEKSSLPTWDEVAGDPTTYENTFVSSGNTIALMSANVHPEFQGIGFGPMLIKSVQDMAKKIEGIQHIVGSFRPTGFGSYKSKIGKDLPLDQYYKIPASQEQFKPIDKEIDWSSWGGNPPIDPWFRSLARNGMTPIVVDTNAMTVPVTAAEFELFKSTHKPNMWKIIEGGVWLCGEVGNFYPNPDGSYTYKESNLCGELPLANI